MYHERVSPVDGSVLWHSVSIGPCAAPTRVLPDGCIDLLWMDGRLFVAGPDTSAKVVARPTGSTATGLRFRPGFAPGVLGLPAVDLTDLLVPLDDVLAVDRVHAWEEVLHGAPLDASSALDDLTGKWRAAAGTASTAYFGDDVVARLANGRRVDELAIDVGWSTRQLHRRCLDSFGYGAKTLARIMRMQRAVVLARGGCALAVVAAQTGYADQQHMSRDVRSLAGTTLGELLAAW